MVNVSEVASSGAIDCLQRLVSEMICCLSTVMPNDLHAVTHPGLKTHFLVWLSVSADDTDDSVMHL